MANKRIKAKTSAHKNKPKSTSESMPEGTEHNSDVSIPDDDKATAVKDAADNVVKEVKPAIRQWDPDDVNDRWNTLLRCYGKALAEQIIADLDGNPGIVEKITCPIISWEGDDYKTSLEKATICYGEETAKELLAYAEACMNTTEAAAEAEIKDENMEIPDIMEASREDTSVTEEEYPTLLEGYPVLPSEMLTTNPPQGTVISQPGYNVYDQRMQVLIPGEQQVINLGGRQDLQDLSEANSWSNYVVRPIGRRVFIGRDGREQYENEEIEVELAISGCRPESFTIHPKDIRRLPDLISDHFPAAYSLDRNKQSTKLAEKLFRDALKNVPVERIFTDFGWQFIDGRPIYAHDGLNPSPLGLFQTGKTITFDKTATPEKVGHIVMEAMKLCNEVKTIATLLCFSLMGVLYRLFEEAGFPPRFLFFLHGPTGSMKTAISRVLFLQVTDTRNGGDLMRRFEDSPASLERGIALNGGDTITLVDDFCPPKDNKEQREKTEKIELLRRIAGDGITKSRSNSRLEDVRGENVSGVIAVTGETVGSGMSSMLRCFFCPMMRNSVNLEVLTEFQENPMLYATVIAYFSDFLGSHWSYLINFMRESINGERKIWRHCLNEPRLIDAASQFGMTANILGGFLKNYCMQDESKVDALTKEMRDAIMQNAMMSESYSVEESLSERIAHAINLLLLGNELIILNGRPDQSTFSEIDGFREKGYLYLKPERLYSKVSHVLALKGMKLGINANEMARLLVSEGIAASTPNGKGKRTNFARIPIGGNKHVQFIKIFEDALGDYAS